MFRNSYIVIHELMPMLRIDTAVLCVHVCTIFGFSQAIASLERTLCAWLAMVAMLLTPAKQATDAHTDAELGTELRILPCSALRHQVLTEPVILKP